MKKIAIPVDGNGVLDAHFGHCKYFIFLKVENDKIVSEQIIQPPKHEPGVLPMWLIEQEVTDVLTGGLGQKARQLLEHNGVKVMTGISSDSAENIAQAYIKGVIEVTGNFCNH